VIPLLALLLLALAVVVSDRLTIAQLQQQLAAAADRAAAAASEQSAATELSARIHADQVAAVHAAAQDERHALAAAAAHERHELLERIQRPEVEPFPDVDADQGKLWVSEDDEIRAARRDAAAEAERQIAARERAMDEADRAAGIE
jgi:hypothetical protein